MLALRVIFLGCGLADVLNFMKKYCVRFILNRTPLLEAPAEYFAGGAGLVGFSTANDTTQVANGLPDPRAVAAIPSDLEIRIDGNSTFEVDCDGTTFTTAAAFFMRVYLDGVWEKA